MLQHATTCYKFHHSRKYQNFQTNKEIKKLLPKKKFLPETKLMIENLQDELYQLENKQAKGTTPCANIRECTLTYVRRGPECFSNLSKIFL